MKTVTATKTFRPRDRKGEVIHRGTVLELEDTYAQELIRSDMAIESKSLKDYQNKMAHEYEDKGQKLTTETPEQRTQGLMGETSDSESPEERTQGYSGPLADKDKDRDKHVEIVPVKGGAEIDPKRRAFLEAEGKRVAKEYEERERNRLGRFEKIKVADTVGEAETQEDSDKRKVGRGHEERDKDKDAPPRTDAGKAADKDQKNRDNR
jgi:hypothetical protein